MSHQDSFSSGLPATVSSPEAVAPSLDQRALVEMAKQLFASGQDLLAIARHGTRIPTPIEYYAPRKWAAVIKAWADGASVEFRYAGLDDDRLNPWMPSGADGPDGDRFTVPNWNNGELEFRAVENAAVPRQTETAK